MALDLEQLKARSTEYKNILKNTKNYRKEWNKTVRPLIEKTLEEMLDITKIVGQLIVNEQIQNLESIVLDLGKTASGITQTMEDTDIKRMMVKSNGTLIYQQLFNGKIMVMTVSPFIEGYAEPKPPRPLEILRPHELTDAVIVKHMEKFLQEITMWEDYDDDVPSAKEAFNPIGFQTVQMPEE